MVSEQEQMKTIQDKILKCFNPEEISLLLDQLESFGHRSLPCLSEILKISYNRDVIQSTNFCISRVKQQFEWSDSEVTAIKFFILIMTHRVLRPTNQIYLDRGGGIAKDLLLCLSDGAICLVLMGHQPIIL